MRPHVSESFANDGQAKQLRRELTGFAGTIFSVSLALEFQRVPHISLDTSQGSMLGMAQLAMLLVAVPLPILTWLLYARLFIFAAECTVQCTSLVTVLLAMSPLAAALALVCLPEPSMNGARNIDGAMLVVFTLLLVGSLCQFAALELARRKEGLTSERHVKQWLGLKWYMGALSFGNAVAIVTFIDNPLLRLIFCLAIFLLIAVETVRRTRTEAWFHD